MPITTSICKQINIKDFPAFTIIIFFHRNLASVQLKALKYDYIKNLKGLISKKAKGIKRLAKIKDRAKR